MDDVLARVEACRVKHDAILCDMSRTYHQTRDMLKGTIQQSDTKEVRRLALVGLDTEHAARMSKVHARMVRECGRVVLGGV